MEQNQNLAVIVCRGLSGMLHFREKLSEWAVKPLHCAPAISLDLYKRAPGIEIRPIGLRLSPSNQSCAATSSFASLPTNQDSAFGPIKLWGFRVLMCMKTDQSGIGSSNSSLYKPALPLSPCGTLSVSIEDCFPVRAITLEWSYNRAEHICLAKAELSHWSWTVTLEL